MHIENREADALEYIKEHRLDGLFKQLCELLIYNQVKSIYKYKLNLMRNMHVLL